MTNIIKDLIAVARRFTGYDFAIFKITLLSAGILLGAYFSSFFIANIAVVWIVGVLCWVLLMLQIIRYYRQ